MTDEDLKELLASHSEVIRHDFNAAVLRFESQSEETRGHFDVTAEQMRLRFDATAEQMQRHFDVTAEQMRLRFDVTAERMERHFDVTVEHFDARFDLLAEAVVQLDQKLDRTAERLDENIDRSAADTQAMIRFVHADLDRRVTALEKGHRSPE